MTLGDLRRLVMGKINRSWRWRPREKKEPIIAAPKLIPLGTAKDNVDAIKADISTVGPALTNDQFDNFLQFAVAKRPVFYSFFRSEPILPVAAPGLVLEVVDGALRYGCGEDEYICAETPFAAIERFPGSNGAWLYGCGRVWRLDWAGDTLEDFSATATLRLISRLER